MNARTVIALTIVLCTPLAAGGATYVSPAGTIQAGTSYFSLPALPNPTDAPTIFAGIPIDGKLSYWCRMTQHWLVYGTDWSGLTPVQWHMGWKLESDQPYTITFQGAQPTTERSTCLNPVDAGYACISQPYNWEAAWSAFLFSSDKAPGIKYSTSEAVALGWIEDYLIEGAQDSGVRITLDGAGGTSTTVRPWQAYWVQSKIGPSTGKLTIYWPATPAPEPGSFVALAAGLAGMVAIRRRPR